MMRTLGFQAAIAKVICDYTEPRPPFQEAMDKARVMMAGEKFLLAAAREALSLYALDSSSATVPVHPEADPAQARLLEAARLAYGVLSGQLGNPDGQHQRITVQLQAALQEAADLSMETKP